MSYRLGIKQYNHSYSEAGIRVCSFVGNKGFINMISTKYKEVNVQKIEKQEPTEL